MIFVLQNSQNFGKKVTHLKLDELIHAVPEAQSEVASAEEKEEHKIDALKTAAIEKTKIGDNYAMFVDETRSNR